MKDITGPVEITGTVSTRGARRVGLDQDGIGMLQSILSNQYTNKHAAVLREYFCNGWDSHIEAGKTDRPVRVTLPSDMQPSLLIQDEGRGLAEHEMIDIFGTYAKSTKRDTDEQTGAFGIGSKSAWTMGQQFVVTGVKDGVKTTALFALDDEGIGTCNIMGVSETDEPNGVLISLAVPDVEAMNEAATEFFETVDRGTALVNGVEPESIFDTIRSVNDQVYIRDDHRGQVYVVMGQVSYQVDQHILRLVAKNLKDTDAYALAASLSEWHSTSSVYFRVPIGDVTVHPSRERLRDTNKTVATLSSLVTGLSQDLTESVQKQVDAAPSLYQAALAVEEAVTTLGSFKVSRRALTYKGQSVPKTVQVVMPTFFLTSKTYRYNSPKIVGQNDTRLLEISQAERTLTVTGVPEGEESKVSRYLKRYLENTERDVEWVFVTSQPWGSFGWFAFGTETGAPTLTLDEFRAELRAMRETSAPRSSNEPSYTTGHRATASRNLHERNTLSEIISWGKDIVIVHERSRYSGVEEAALADYTVVVLLPQQSEEMLRKRIAEAGTIKVVENPRQIIKDYVEAQFHVTDEERIALGADDWLETHSNYSGMTWADTLRNSLGEDWEQVTHPALLELLETVDVARMVARDVTRDRKFEIRAQAQHLGRSIDIVPFEFDLSSEEAMFPMLSHISNYRLGSDAALRADVIAYINSKA